MSIRGPSRLEPPPPGDQAAIGRDDNRMREADVRDAVAERTQVDD